MQNQEPTRDLIQDLEATITDAAIELMECDANGKMRVEIALSKAYAIVQRLEQLAG